MAAELVVEIDRSAAGTLGIDVETGRSSAAWDGQTVLIRQVKPGGAVHAWCQQHPERAVQPGHRIVAANSCRGDADRILAECQKPGILRLELRKETPSERPAPRLPPPDSDRLEELCQAFRAAPSAAEAVLLLRREQGRSWHPAWGAEALLRVALRSTAKTRKAWAKDTAVVRLAEHLQQDAKQPNQDLARLEVSLMSLEALRRLGFPSSLESASLAQREALASTKSLCRMLWLAAGAANAAGGEAAGLLRELRKRSDFDGLDLRMLFDAARRWSERTWLQDPERLMPGRVLVKEAFMAEECVINFSLTISVALEGWSLLFSFAAASSPEELTGLYVSKDGCLAVSSAKSKEGLKADLSKRSEPVLQAKHLALVSLRRAKTLEGDRCTLSVEGQEALELPQLPAGQIQIICRDCVGTKVAEAAVGHLVHRPLRSCPGKDVPLLRKLLTHLRCADGGLFPQDLFPASELVRLAEDLAHLEVCDDEALKSLGREILQRRPELEVQELQLAKGAFAMLQLSLQAVWATVGTKVSKRGGRVITQQAFVPRVEKRRKGSPEVEQVSPPRSPPRR
ncbi:unnamed protein product [Effrenium voratum]|nr:unnamed protein product [Effrenium voratum]